jgi:hypothetical protein
MSDLVKFVVYYGYGTVRTTPIGVVLSEFQYQELILSAPKTWRVCQLKEWLTLNFGINPNIQCGCACFVEYNNILAFEADRADPSVGALVSNVREQGNLPITLMLPVAKEVTSHEGEGESSHILVETTVTRKSHLGDNTLGLNKGMTRGLYRT